MRNILLTAVGVLLIGVTIADVFRTVLWSSRGGGPLTTALTAGARRVRSRLRSQVLRSAIGPLTLASTVLMWTALLLVGFTLATQHDPDALRHATTGVPAGWSERAYVIGYTIFTMGNGDFSPSTDAMRALIVVANGSGMLLVTLSVTYLVPVIGASVSSRAFADDVLSLGDTPVDVVVGAWDGQRVHLDHQLRTAGAQLSTLAHQHLTYPVLHLFGSPDPEVSAPLAVRRLDETLTLLDALDPRVVPPTPGRRQLRSSIERYSRTYGTRGHTSAAPPEAPDLGVLRAAGVPLRLGEEQFRQMLDDLAVHRGRVQSLVVGAGGSPA